MIAWQVGAVLLLAYLPGQLIFRSPIGNRDRRARLPAEERVFWCILLSLALTSCLGLGLAAAGWYRFSRLLWIDAAASLAIGIAARGDLRLGRLATKPGWSSLIPAALVAGSLWLNFFVPPSEYIIGGKDPGAYVNEGIQIAQRGTLVIADEVARAVPPRYRSMFFTGSDDPSYFGGRFMGFFLIDPDRGIVVGQFPHLYPVWVAIAYGVNGLTGARMVLGLWAVLGVLAVYFAGARILGRPAAAAGAGLLTVNLLQIWYARYPNAELVMQPLVFGGLLAYLHAEHDGDSLFAPTAGVLFALSVFAHVTGAVAVAAIGIAALLAFIEDGRLRLSFAVPLVAGTCAALMYLAWYLSPYFQVPLGYLRAIRPLHIVLSVAILALAGAGVRYRARRAATGHDSPWVPLALTIVVWLLATYAWFYRVANGPLAPHDADSLRTFARFYLTPAALVAALIGFAFVSRSFSTSAPLLLMVSVFCAVFFYKIRVVPEHFWAARRFLSVILPGSLLLVGAAAFTAVRSAAVARLGLNRRSIGIARHAAGLIFVVLLGWRYFSASESILRHVEYAGVIPHLETLAATVGAEDLVLFESRAASDVHVLALPMAYVYARKALVFVNADLREQGFHEFLVWARARYRRVLFVGGGGTTLLSSNVSARRVSHDDFQVPEYESVLNGYPRRVKNKVFSYGVYELKDGPVAGRDFIVDVGDDDVFFVRRFHASERRANGFTFRWTQNVSYVELVGIRDEARTLTLWMSSGNRPDVAGPANVQLFLNERPLGAVTVASDLRPYQFEVPENLIESIAGSDQGGELRVVSSTWNPSRALGGGDDRELGVIVDRIELK